MNYLIFFEYGVFQIDKNKFLKCSKELKVEILKKILTTSSGKIFPPRESSIINLIKSIQSNHYLRYTLHSCLLEINSNKISVFREASNIKEEKKIIPKGKPYLWDNRFFYIQKTLRLNVKKLTLKTGFFKKIFFL